MSKIIKGKGVKVKSITFQIHSDNVNEFTENKSCSQTNSSKYAISVISEAVAKLNCRHFELSEELSKYDRQRTDVEHYIEFNAGKLNACDGYKAYKMLQDVLIQRRKVKDELGLTCFVDTNGSIDLSQYEEFVKLTDKFMIDVKSMDEEEHLKVTGLNNHTVIKNLKYLLDLDKVYEIRTVIAPNLNNENTVREASKIIKDKCKYKFNIYRHYGVRKEGLDFHGSESPSEEEINKCYKIYEENIL